MIAELGIRSAGAYETIGILPIVVDILHRRPCTKRWGEGGFRRLGEKISALASTSLCVLAVQQRDANASRKAVSTLHRWLQQETAGPSTAMMNNQGAEPILVASANHSVSAVVSMRPHAHAPSSQALLSQITTRCMR